MGGGGDKNYQKLRDVIYGRPQTVSEKNILPPTRKKSHFYLKIHNSREISSILMK
jgi:hypothetical protein